MPARRTRRPKEDATVAIMLAAWQWSDIAEACRAARDATAVKSISRRIRGVDCEELVTIEAPRNRLATVAQHCLSVRCEYGRSGGHALTMRLSELEGKGQRNGG